MFTTDELKILRALVSERVFELASEPKTRDENKFKDIIYLEYKIDEILKGKKI